MAVIGPQIGSLEHGAHIIVGTPGRIEDHLRKGRLDLSFLKLLVLDEADRMLDMGFQPTLEAIVAELPARRQTLLFSATFPGSIEALAASVTREPQRVTVDEPQQAPTIEQRFYRVADEQQRRQAVALLLSQEQPTSALVFCNTRRECDEVANGLRQQGFAALPLHGDMEQRDRDQVLVQFANHSVSVLVATDVAARGLGGAGCGDQLSVGARPRGACAPHWPHRSGRSQGSRSHPLQPGRGFQA